jgi:2-polyprenyl-3-methyl-5-hydroxy-6-metoxy-1,4-benzoquinol methylase
VVLDVGCGLGNGMKTMVLAPGSDVHGIDTDPALAEVVKNYSFDSIYNVEKQYDIVTCIDAIEHVVDDLRFFRKLLSIARRKLYITTPNFSRSKALNHAHCREYSISQFLNIFKPDQLWVASPDGWFNLRCLVVGNETTYSMDKTWNDGSVDGCEWPHYCGVWNK